MTSSSGQVTYYSSALILYVPLSVPRHLFTATWSLLYGPGATILGNPRGRRDHLICLLCVWLPYKMDPLACPETSFHLVSNKQAQNWISVRVLQIYSPIGLHLHVSFSKQPTLRVCLRLEQTALAMFLIMSREYYQ